MAVALCLALSTCAEAGALLGLTRARWRVDPVRGTFATLLFRKDAALSAPTDPTCAGSPTGARLSLVAGNAPPMVVALPCERWYAARGRYRYADADGTVKISYGGGRLAIRIARLPPPAPEMGPIAVADVRLAVGATSLCGRITAFTRSDATLVASHGPSVACPAVCGDGFRDDGEACDDGNTTGGDGCRADCTVEQCGDGIVDPGEACDGGACCSASCSLVCAHDVDGDGRITVLCLGDSNSTDFFTYVPSWCTVVAGMLGPQYTFVNRSVFGLNAISAAPFLANGLDTVAPDAVVLALGTNDVPFRAPEDVAVALLDLDAQVRAHCYGPGRCVQSWVASIPPRYPPQTTLEAEITSTNELLASILSTPTSRLVDFATDMSSDLYLPDGLHLNADGQVVRAERVRSALTRQ
jgi:cysteine-rich repeat protein